MLFEENEPEGKRTDIRHMAPQWIVTMSASLRADTRRLFQALTVPEYMEAWIYPPGFHPSCHSVVARVDDRYTIEHFCEGRRTLSISGSYLVCQRRKLIFTCQREGSSPQSYVDIRLCGDFESSTLQLRQHGLHSAEDYEWHRAWWAASLAKLGGLFDRLPVDAGSKPRLSNRSARDTVAAMR
jgi:hypothetical protein